MALPSLPCADTIPQKWPRDIGQANHLDGDDATPSLWAYLRDDLDGTAAPAAGSQAEIVVPLKRDRRTGGREQNRNPEDKA